MKYLIILSALFVASAVNAGSSGGTMGSPKQLENSRITEGNPGSTLEIESTLKDLNKIDLLMRNRILLDEEETMVIREIGTTQLRLKALLKKLEENGVDTQNIEPAAP